MIWIDQLGRKITLDSKPKRIVSTVPSQTELLLDLGLQDKLVGCTLFCIHPEEKVEGIAKVGGTKKLKLDKIRELQPDLIIANREENEEAQILELAKEFPVWISDIYDFESATDMIRILGNITGRSLQAEGLSLKIENRFNGLIPGPSRNTLYLIWRKPWMGAGNDTFISHMMERCGFKNVLSKQDRYPEVNEDDLQRLKPDLVLLSSEPFPFKQKHIKEIQQLLPRAQIKLIDGQMFSWYGSRMLHAPEYFRKLIKETKEELAAN